MKYNGIIESKLRILEEKLAEIESWNILSFEALQKSSLSSGISSPRSGKAETQCRIKFTTFVNNNNS